MRAVSLSEDRFDEFAALINALADYEKWPPLAAAATSRLRADAFGSPRRFEAALALDDVDRAIGYALWFETYSTSLARPTVHLEDLFVLQESRACTPLSPTPEPWARRRLMMRLLDLLAAPGLDRTLKASSS